MYIESCGEMFADPKKQVSSNYGIGSDGRIALYVEEKNRSWCSSNAANDNHAVTMKSPMTEVKIQASIFPIKLTRLWLSFVPTYAKETELRD